MNRHILGSFLIAVVLIFPGMNGPAIADDSVTGAVYLYAKGEPRPTPLAGYEVKLYDPQEKKWSNPSITDSYGRYAFSGISNKTVMLTVGKTYSHWYQGVWRQEVTAPGIVNPIVLPQAANIIPRVSYVKRQDKKDTYDFSLWLDVPEEQKAGISRVVYLFSNPTFTQKEYESKRPNDSFKVGYSGWGCLEKVIIKIERPNANSRINFNMCEALKEGK